MLHRARKGSAMTLAILVAVIIAALVTAMAFVAGESAQRSKALTKIDQAFFAAESGAQRVTWYCKNGQMDSITSPLTGTVNGVSYSTSWSTVSGTTIAITSTGSNGAAAYTLSQWVTPPDPGMPVLQSSGDFDNKNIEVTGNVYVGGNYSNGGSGSITGNLTYHGSASNTSDVSGSVTQAADAPDAINFTTLGANLSASASQTLNGDQNNKSFNFDLLGGTDKVIKVNGNVTNPTFVGTGTLYVTGSVSTGAFGSSTLPVHIVAHNSVTTSNNVTIYGSIYTDKNWERGKFDLTGTIYTSGVVKSNNGKSYLKQGETAWFDPRSASTGGGGGSTTITKFTGPQP